VNRDSKPFGHHKPARKQRLFAVPASVKPKRVKRGKWARRRGEYGWLDHGVYAGMQRGHSPNIASKSGRAPSIWPADKVARMERTASRLEAALGGGE